MSKRLTIYDIKYLHESFQNKKGERIEYCNTGESYALTLVYHSGRGRYLVASWGDLAEREGTH